MPLAPSASDGFGPDAQLSGGGGFAFGKPLDNYFLARARVGFLYAHEPLSLQLGVTLEAGGLARFGVGGELELNAPHALFGSAGLARVDGGQWMSHAIVGWLVLGIEWQHRFGGDAPSDALMFHVRLPLGTWWLEQRQKRAAERALRALKTSQPPLQLPVDEPAPATAPTAPSAPVPGSGAEVAPATTPAAPSARDRELYASIAAAQQARDQGDFAAEAMALARAYALAPSAELALQLIAAEERLGKWLLALAELRRLLMVTELSPQLRAQAENMQAALQTKLPHLRLAASGVVGQEQVLIDGVVEPTALHGYDVPIDPGEHELIIQRQARTVAQQHFRAAEAELVRLSLTLP
jgi:hypothetical protein